MKNDVFEQRILSQKPNLFMNKRGNHGRIVIHNLNQKVE